MLPAVHTHTHPRGTPTGVVFRLFTKCISLKITKNSLFFSFPHHHFFFLAPVVVVVIDLSRVRHRRHARKRDSTVSFYVASRRLWCISPGLIIILVS